MAINMKTVKNIEFNNKIVKKIEDSNGNILWQAFKGVKANPIKIRTYIQTGVDSNYNTIFSDPLYWTISQLSSSAASPSSISSASEFYLLSKNQVLALLDENFDFYGDGMYNNEYIGSIEDGYFHLSPNISVFYICFIQNNKLYFVSNKTTNAVTNNGLLGYTDDYTNAYLFTTVSYYPQYDDILSASYEYYDSYGGHHTGYYYTDNRNTLKYVTIYTAGMTYKSNISATPNIIPYQSITNPNANN